MAQQAVAGLGARLLAGLGDVPAQQHAPVLAVDGLCRASAAAASAKPHCVGSALSPSSDSEPIEMTPMPCLPASVMPDGLICEATANGISSCSGRSCSAASCSVNQSLSSVTRSPREQPADDADRLVLAVALHHRVDAERVRVRGQRARPGAEDRPAAGHVVELHHALGDVERVVIGQRDDAGAELDALGALARRGEEHLGRGDHLPAAGMVLAAPELVVAEPVEVLDEVEIAAELQHRVLADRVVRGEEGAEAKTGHRLLRKSVWKRDQNGTRSSGGKLNTMQRVRHHQTVIGQLGWLLTLGAFGAWLIRADPALT